MLRTAPATGQHCIPVQKIPCQKDSRPSMAMNGIRKVHFGPPALPPAADLARDADALAGDSGRGGSVNRDRHNNVRTHWVRATSFCALTRFHHNM